jgi:type II secretory pathway pseudopilin PulG
VRARERGAILIIIMVGVAVTTIGLAAATQAWTTTWRRDREEELIFRAGQYVNAILAYRKEHGGQFPLNLEDLYKPGPRRLRYIRRLYKDPIAKDGKWGLLYLMPGGQGVYDPKAAQAAKAQTGSGEWSKWETAGTNPAGQGLSGQPPGFGAPGQAVPGAPGTGAPFPPPSGLQAAEGMGDEERVSEPPIGWPIVGVISRAFGKEAEGTYKIYKGHDQVNEWQFHVFDRGAELPPPPGSPPGRRGPGFLGPGFGGRGPISGIGDGTRPFRGGQQRDLWPGPSGGGGKQPKDAQQDPNPDDPNR